MQASKTSVLSCCPRHLPPKHRQARETGGAGGHGRLCCQILEFCCITEQKVTVAAALHQLSVVKCVVLLTGEKQHLFLSRQHNSGLCSPEVPSTSVFCASACATGLGPVPTAQQEAARCIQRAPRQPYGQVLYSFPGSDPASTAGVSSFAPLQEASLHPKQHSAQHPNDLSGHPGKGLGTFLQDQSARSFRVQRAAVPLQCGCAAKPWLLCVQLGSLWQCKPTQPDLGQPSGALWLGSSISQSSRMHRCLYWS